jgi:hypothetical protein
MADLGLCPDERSGALIVRIDKSFDVIFQLRDGCEGCARKGFSLQDGEAVLDQIEP